MQSLKNLLFIINRYSGKGYSSRIEKIIQKTCRYYHCNGNIVFTQQPGHARELAREGSVRHDAVIAVGGDGTVNETAGGLVNGKIPLGILPIGSGNGLARHLGISMHLDTALRNLFASKPVTIDTFYLNKRLGVNVAGIGFDGHVANLFGDRSVPGLWGYFRLVVREFFRYPEFQAHVTDHRNNTLAHLNAFLLAIANSSQYGNNAFIAPEADVMDQVLHLVCVRKIPVYRLPDMAIKLFSAKLSDNFYYSIHRIHEPIHIHLPHEVAYHIDGEPCGFAHKFSLTLNPKSLTVLVPVNK
jgi:diacylglycerol kinase (ATP)